MSGKEPPRGPRALRAPPTGPSNHHHHPHPHRSHSHHSHHHSQPTASSSRLPPPSLPPPPPATSTTTSGVAPPTGPRSLLNGLASAGGRGAQALPPAKGYVNGLGIFSAGKRAPPSGPKGKGPALPSSGATSPTGPSTNGLWPNGRPPPTGPSALMKNGIGGGGSGNSNSSSNSSAGLNGSVPTGPRAPISFSLAGSSSSSSSKQTHQRPPSPSFSPPPPPPPISPPPHLPNGDDMPPPRAPSSTPPPPAGPPPARSPPPPPPAEVPNDRSPISIKLPMAVPSEPKVAPPPLPPDQPTLEPLISGRKEVEREKEREKEKEKEKEKEREKEREQERRREQEEARDEPRPPSIAPPPLPPPDPRVNSLPRHQASSSSSSSSTRPKSPSPSSSSRRDPPNHVRSHLHSKSPTRSRPSRRSRSRSRSRSPSPPRPISPLPEGVTVTYKRIPGQPRSQSQILYSLSSPPQLPPRSSYIRPNAHNFRVLFDSSCDKDRYGEVKALMDNIRAGGKEERIVDNGKGKFVVYRHEGETVKGEKEVTVSDPRKEAGFKGGRARSEFYVTSYEYDSNTPGPPPPTNILIFGFSELTPTPKIRQHFQKYGSVISCERELDRVTGGQMGVASIKYATHEEAKRAVEGEEGRNFTLSSAGGGGLALTTVGKGMEKDSVKVIFDGEGKLLKLLMVLYDEKRRREKERAGAPGFATGPSASASATPGLPNGHIPPGQQQQHPGSSIPPRPFPRPAHLPPHPLSHLTPTSGPAPRGLGPPPFARGGAHADRVSITAAPMRQPPPSLVRARAMNAARSSVPQNMPSLSAQHGLQTPETDSSRPETPIHAHSMRGRGRGALPGHLQRHSYSSAHYSRSPSKLDSYTPTHTSTSTPRGSRSPSPAPVLRSRRLSSDAKTLSRSRTAETPEEKEKKHRYVLEDLAKNGYDHARIDERSLSGGSVREEDVREFFAGFPVERVLHDHLGWYITFDKSDAARRAARVLAIGTHTLANRSVTVTVHPPPHPSELKQPLPHERQRQDQQPHSTSSILQKGGDLLAGTVSTEKRVWEKPEEVIDEAGKIVMRELRMLLEKDVMERVVSAQIRKVVVERGKERRESAVEDVLGQLHVDDARMEGERERQRLKGLSFRKRKQKVDVTTTAVDLAETAQDKTHEPEPKREQERELHREEVGVEVETAETKAIHEEPPVAVTVSEEERVREEAQHQEPEPEINAEEPSKRHPEKEERPRKRRKKAEEHVEREREVESEDEGADITARIEVVEPVVPASVEDVQIVPPADEAIVSPAQRKRSLSPTPVDEPPAKRPKIAEDQDLGEDEKVDIEADIEEVIFVVPPSAPVPSETPVTPVAPAKNKKKQSTKKAEKADKVAEKDKEKKPSKRSKKSKADRAVLEALVIPPQIEMEAPSVAEVRVSASPPPAWASSVLTISEPPLPVVPEKQLPPPKRYSPLPESAVLELVDDEEDLYLAKLALSLDVESPDFAVQEEIAPPSDPNAPPPFRKHVTGSARSEGYYKISHAEKSAYVAQYALRGAGSGGASEKEAAAIAPQEPIVSSRSNRANARRRAQGLEEMNQLQLAVALSKGESAAATEVMKFNQLQTRKKHLRFARSPIHDWGLYAMERISRGEMVIEYVGEIIRAAVADKREKAYERQGIGSSYLFRIDEDLVVDATKKGNLGRLINHSCDPNCTAKIITINGEKKIVIYAKQDIELGDEITYDYHFPIEQDKIPCLCGSAKCRGFLN